MRRLLDRRSLAVLLLAFGCAAEPASDDAALGAAFAAATDACKGHLAAVRMCYEAAMSDSGCSSRMCDSDELASAFGHCTGVGAGPEALDSQLFQAWAACVSAGCEAEVWRASANGGDLDDVAAACYDRELDFATAAECSPVVEICYDPESIAG